MYSNEDTSSKEELNLLITFHILLLKMVKRVAMMTMPVDFCPCSFVVKLSPLVSSEGVVAENLLNVGVEDITPKFALISNYVIADAILFSPNSISRCCIQALLN